MIIKEGLVKLEVPEDHLKKRHFYNPKMELTRDLSILILRTLNPKNWVVCDALAALGARGIRIAKETDVSEVWINDANPEVIPFIKKNVKINEVEDKVKIFNLDAKELLLKRKFDYIDIDPFGSPVRFFDSTARAIEVGGLIGTSATDTGALCGSKPKTCAKRYGISNFKTDFYNEVGVRALIGSFVKILNE